MGSSTGALKGVHQSSNGQISQDYNNYLDQNQKAKQPMDKYTPTTLQ
jgi:hypothetical protein